MPELITATPRLSVRLFKTISRETIDGQTAVSNRYNGKDDYINLTPFLQVGSSVRTSKSIREPAGGFVITFADMPRPTSKSSPFTSLDSIYGLVEPMDVIEIRMWGGVGPLDSDDYPIVMRGFVSEVQRQQGVSEDGKPVRHVIVSGMDYGKIWQTYMILYLMAYVERKALLTSYNLWELFGIKAQNTMKSSEFVRKMIEMVINPHLAGFLPDRNGIEREIKTEDLLVKHGKIGNAPQGDQGSVYEILKKHGDVGTWNELYIEDREDGVHCVYRPIPFLHITQPEGSDSALIQDDAVMPPVVLLFDEDIVTLTTARSDQSVGNFYWVNNTKYDLIDDMSRKLMSIPENDKRSVLKDYPNTAVKYYGTRAMYAETLQNDDDIVYDGSSLDENGHVVRNKKQESWLMNRLRIFSESNRDNVVFERGQIRVKGGVMRPDEEELMKAGDYVSIAMGNLPAWYAYVTQVDHEFLPFQGYTQNLIFERGEGFVRRTEREDGMESPWLAEQATRSF